MHHDTNFRIDSHKLIFHPHRVVQWLDGIRIFPVYMEISPSGACNHRCTFCALDYKGYSPNILDTALLVERIAELAQLGVSSIMFGGEGEPLLHPDIDLITARTRRAGIDVAMSTNGVRLLPALAEKILPHLSWIKLSVNAGSPEAYAAIHRSSPDDFTRVFENITSSAHLIKSKGLECTLGVQAVLLPENAAEIELLAELARDAGASYLVVKPYSQHLKSLTQKYADIDYAPYQGLSEKLERFNDNSFSVIFRSNTINKMLSGQRSYGRCLALPFWSYIDAEGNVWGCSSHMGDGRFLYGNILEESFRDIWLGERRMRSLDHVAAELDLNGCRMNCRMDEINRYLWELTHPGPHANFI